MGHFKDVEPGVIIERILGDNKWLCVGLDTSNNENTYPLLLPLSTPTYLDQLNNRSFNYRVLPGRIDSALVELLFGGKNWKINY